MTERLFCQSCAMPLEKEEFFATEKDGAKNKEYCIYCYKSGEFTDPNMTLEKMLENVEYIMKKMHVSQELIDKTKQMIPQMKRWKK
ncbi:zinc ribbon domain-containing protein [Candidatus Dependentiae bacterium]